MEDTAVRCSGGLQCDRVIFTLRILSRQRASGSVGEPRGNRLELLVGSQQLERPPSKTRVRRSQRELWTLRWAGQTPAPARLSPRDLALQTPPAIPRLKAWPLPPAGPAPRPPAVQAFSPCLPTPRHSFPKSSLHPAPSLLPTLSFLWGANSSNCQSRL